MQVKIILMVFVAGSLQEGTFKCERETTIYQSAFLNSYYDRTPKTKCTFEGLQSVNEVTALPTNSLTSRQSINTIIFLNSSLSKLPDKAFATFSLVRKIDASRLVLDEISPTAFFGLKMLDFLDLSSNQVKVLTARTFATMQIKLLDLSMNYIEAIDDTAFLNAEIEKLILSFNKLKTIKFLNSFNFFNLVEMNNNLIETFSNIEVKKDGWTDRNRGIFGETPEYPKLYMQNNKLTKVECVSSVRINTIDLENNPYLSELRLNNCPVEQVDVTGCELLNKVVLNNELLGFTAKNLRTIDIDVDDAQSLVSLSLSNSTLSPALFDKITRMENLTMLDLSYNNIGPLNVSTFAKLKSLQFLLLKATNISNIQFGTFSHQHAVKIFDISDNHLKLFDMNMIFSMSSLLSLDLSGNDLTLLENVESAHFTFTLLQKIDLSHNKWPCSYLMRLMKIFRIYKVAMTRSNIEENETNIHGVGCIHVDGDDENFIEPLSPDSSNVTDIRAKMNDMINEMSKNAQFRSNVDSRLKQLENRLDNQASASATFAASRSDSTQKIEVKNSAVVEIALGLVFLCCAAYVAINVVSYLRINFLGKPKKMRAMSENTLSMTVDDY